MLLADLQQLGHVAVGDAADQQQLQHFEAQEVAAGLPLADELAQCTSDGDAFKGALLRTPGGAGGGLLVRIDAVAQHVVAGVGVGELRPTAFAAQLIRDLVGGNRE